MRVMRPARPKEAVPEMVAVKAVSRSLGAQTGEGCARAYPDQVENECDSGSAGKPTLRDAFW